MYIILKPSSFESCNRWGHFADYCIKYIDLLKHRYFYMKFYSIYTIPDSWLATINYENSKYENISVTNCYHLSLIINCAYPGT